MSSNGISKIGYALPCSEPDTFRGTATVIIFPAPKVSSVEVLPPIDGTDEIIAATLSLPFVAFFASLIVD